MAQNTPNPLFEQGTERANTPSENSEIQTVTTDTKGRIAKLSATVGAVILAGSMNAQAGTLSRDAEILSSCDANNNGEIDTPGTYGKTRATISSSEKDIIRSEHRCESRVGLEISRRNIEESRRNIEESRRNTEESRKKSEEYRRETEKLKQILDMLGDN